ncbi:c-type cytochrome [Solemya elarraichensis gill symbiont]|uniref:Cytochrome C n=1 Tax=Solemya elarraichensis gill symbiont TaxID=1918949 RepID=A0A1T2LC51_9GAMM|nr:c-type cytochrome [Solemya elarraichensis gill symbiont]OOZ42677.1 cytochrome C [Solemya elarraichensis gill symbiont]
MRVLNLSLVLVFVCLSPRAGAVDLENGAEINEVCAACHGEYGQGGKNGEYPRIAGQPAGYTFKQLKLFQDRSRPNMPMVEHVDKRELPDSDMEDISAYLSKIVLPTRLPPVDETAPDFDAYQRLLQTKRLMQIARAEGDIENGKALYKKECRSCHGKEGVGKSKDNVPMLAGQYTKYLWRQVDKYLDGTLVHDEDEPDSELLAEFTREEIRDIFAYLSVADD